MLAQRYWHELLYVRNLTVAGGPIQDGLRAPPKCQHLTDLLKDIHTTYPFQN